jgi:hypothetical protein
MRARLVLFLMAASFTTFLAGAPTFAACKGTPTFEDTFQSLDPSWGVSASDAVVSIGDGKLIISPTPGYVRTVLSQSDYYGDGSICVLATISEASKIDGVQALVAFWAVDTSNVYLLNIGSDGKQGFFKVDRLSNNRWLTPIGWQADPIIKFQLGETNEVELQMAGRRATVVINGKKLGQLNGSPPDGGGLIGVGGGSSAGVTAKIQYQKFQFFKATAP